MLLLTLNVKCISFFFRNPSFKGDLTMSEVRGEGGCENGFNNPATITYGPAIVTVDQPVFQFISNMCLNCVAVSEIREGLHTLA